jgi:hypothetical protein
MGAPPANLRSPLTAGGAHRVEDVQGRRAVVPPVVALLSPSVVGVGVTPDAQTVVTLTVGRVSGRRDRACRVDWRVLPSPDGLQPIDFVGDALPSGELEMRANADGRLIVIRLNPGAPPLAARTARLVLENPHRCEIDATRGAVTLRVDPGEVEEPDPETPWIEVWSDPGDASAWETVWGGAGAPA